MADRDRLDEHLITIEDKLGESEPAPTPRDLGWHLERIEELLDEGGGGGGTTVVPNPEILPGDEVEDLNTIKIGADKFRIAGGSESYIQLDHVDPSAFDVLEEEHISLRDFYLEYIQIILSNQSIEKFNEIHTALANVEGTPINTSVTAITEYGEKFVFGYYSDDDSRLSVNCTIVSDPSIGNKQFNISGSWYINESEPGEQSLATALNVDNSGISLQFAQGSFYFSAWTSYGETNVDLSSPMEDIYSILRIISNNYSTANILELNINSVFYEEVIQGLEVTLDAEPETGVLSISSDIYTNNGSIYLQISSDLIPGEDEVYIVDFSDYHLPARNDATDQIPIFIFEGKGSNDIRFKTSFSSDAIDLDVAADRSIDDWYKKFYKYFPTISHDIAFMPIDCFVIWDGYTSNAKVWFDNESSIIEIDLPNYGYINIELVEDLDPETSEPSGIHYEVDWRFFGASKDLFIFAENTEDFFRIDTADMEGLTTLAAFERVIPDSIIDVSVGLLTDDSIRYFNASVGSISESEYEFITPFGSIDLTVDEIEDSSEPLETHLEYHVDWSKFVIPSGGDTPTPAPTPRQQLQQAYINAADYIDFSGDIMIPVVYDEDADPSYHKYKDEYPDNTPTCEQFLVISNNGTEFSDISLTDIATSQTDYIAVYTFIHDGDEYLFSSDNHAEILGDYALNDPEHSNLFRGSMTSFIQDFKGLLVDTEALEHLSTADAFLDMRPMVVISMYKPNEE